MKTLEIENKHFNNLMRRYIQTVGQYKTAKTELICYALIEICVLACLWLAVIQYDETATGVKEYAMYGITLALFLVSFAGMVFCMWCAKNLMDKRYDMDKMYRQTRNHWVQLTLNNQH